MKSLQDIKDNARTQMQPMAQPLLRPVPLTRQGYVRAVGVAMLTAWLLTLLCFAIFGGKPTTAALVSLGFIVVLVSLLLLKWIGYGMREARGEI